ncbi:MAG: NTP transferase domain-containing protein [Desulfovibrionaceae bacterium]|nr:NTP transferase domain-containing protein [Desulfovibrionaceae bacterium]
MSKSNPKIVAIIQARLGSSRLPLKALLALHDQPLINWVVSRVSQAKQLKQVIVAIPDTQLDQVLAQHLKRLGVDVFMGAEDDVLGRFVGAAHMTQAELIVRVCADNPLIWGEAIDRLITTYRESPCDYCYNHIPKNNLWPDGLGAEIIACDLLEDLDKKAQLASEREHCLNYLWNHPQDFKIKTFDPLEPWLRRPDLKLDIDHVADFQRLSLLPLHPKMDAKAIIAACSR